MNNIEKYYDNNTSTFLKVGQSKESQNIHRLLWSPETKSKEEAINFSNTLINERLPFVENRPVRVLDLGCGVGATLMYLDKHSNQSLDLNGITISGEQVKIGNHFIDKKETKNSLKINIGDFHDLSAFKNQDFIYQIESFVHSNSPELLLKQVSQSLCKKGVYCLIDDFLVGGQQETKQNEKLLEDYKEGWHIGNLNTTEQIIKLASDKGLELVEKVNLTAYLNIYPLRDKLIGLATSIYKVLPVKSIYWESLRGGDALQKATKKGMIAYWLLVFRKK